LKAFGKEIRLSLRRAILPIRDAEPKEPAKGAQMKTTVLQCFLSFPSQADSNFVIGFFHKIYFPSAYRLIAERQINLATSTRDCDCFCKDPKKRTAVCCAPQRYSSFFIVMEERQYLLCW
jgi:hypothetical protein